MAETGRNPSDRLAPERLEDVAEFLPLSARRHLLPLLWSLLLTGTVSCAPPPSQWPTTTPEAAGFSADPGNSLDKAFAEGKLAGLHAVVAVRDGKLVFERYYEGEDERWGRPRGTVTFGPEVIHDLRSVSKSVVSLIYGIALDEEKVPALDAPLIDQFPEYEDLANDPARRRITVRHALTMTLGLEWNEDLPYTDRRNSEVAMEYAEDRYRFVLEQAIVEVPGKTWHYNGGATALLAKLIAKGTGQDFFDYAREKLLEPLDIAEAEWVRGYDGEPAAASGLRLRPRDLAKIGQLTLIGGRWGQRQIVPADWLAESFKPRVDAEDLGYGYQWWLGETRDGKPWHAGFGNGGQRLFVYPHLDLVVVVMAGNYNRLDAWKLGLAVQRDHIFPAFKGP